MIIEKEYIEASIISSRTTRPLPLLRQRHDGLLVARILCRKIVVVGVLRLPACSRCAQEN